MQLHCSLKIAGFAALRWLEYVPCERKCLPDSTRDQSPWNSYFVPALILAWSFFHTERGKMDYSWHAWASSPSWKDIGKHRSGIFVDVRKVSSCPFERDALDTNIIRGQSAVKMKCIHICMHICELWIVETFSGYSTYWIFNPFDWSALHAYAILVESWETYKCIPGRVVLLLEK